MLSSKNGEIKMVLDLLANNTVITQPKIALQPGYSQRKVNRIIAELKKSGLYSAKDRINPGGGL